MTVKAETGDTALTYYLIKIACTTGLIVGISEIAKRSSLFGALLASVPLISVLALMWLYIDTGDTEKVCALARSVFWLVLPSLLLFVTLPFLMHRGMNFYLSMSIAIGISAGGYLLMITVLNHCGVKL